MDSTLSSDSLSRRSRLILAVFSLLAGIEGSVCTVQMITFRVQDAGGFSVPPPTTWIIAVAVVLIAAIFFLATAILVLVQSQWFIKRLLKVKIFFQKHSALSQWIIPLGCLFYLAVQYILSKKFGSGSLLIADLMIPISAWFYLVILEGLLVFVLQKTIQPGSKISKPFLIVLGVFLITWVFTAVTGVGIIPDDRYWNVAGVPVLAKQLAEILIISILVDSLINLIQNKVKKPSKWLLLAVDIAICLTIWVGASFNWINAPFGNSFFTKGPFPPNNDFYPYSDSALMDLGGQYMLIGERLEYPLFTEKSLYAFFLGMLHLLAGQSYLSTTSLQIVVFAVFPVIMYLFCKKFSGRLFGLTAALFALIKESNAITSTYKISVSNSRLYMTEFPTGIAMLVLGVALFMWFRKNELQKPWILLSGGILGFAVMIRTNPLFVIPFLFLICLFVYKFHWKKIFTALLIFIGGFSLTIGPWIVYNQILYGTNPFTNKIESVLYYRFNIGKNSPPPTGLSYNDRFITNLYGKTAPAENDLDEVDSGVSGKLKIIAGHFLNNEIKALFTLPFQLYPQDLNTLLDAPYWKEPIIWEGKLPVSAAAAFALNLGLIALGIAFSWKKWHFSGLVPLLLNVGYYLSNAFGRTSGSRYLLPVDWTIYFYFLFGIVVVLQWLKNIVQVEKISHLEDPDCPMEYKDLRKSSFPTFLTAGVILLLGISIPLINISFPKLYTPTDREKIVEQLTSAASLQEKGITTDQINSFLQQQNSTIIQGRLLYPRYRDFEESSQYGLFMTILTPELQEIFLPIEDPYNQEIIAGTDVIAFGCERDGYIEAFLVYIPEEKQLILSDLSYTDTKCKENN